MKRLTIIACFMLGALAASAQDNAQETAYRRSSLYTMMMPDPALAGEAKAIVEGTFDTIPIPDKYNDHNLDVRTVDISGITVTEADIAAAVESSGDGGGKKKAGKALGKGLKAIGGSSASTAPAASGDETVAKLLKYFNDNHVANQLIAKWYGMSDQMQDGSHFNYWLIADRGLQSASQEELAAAKNVRGGQNKIMDNAAADLIPRTFVMVSSYSYVPAEDIIALVSAAAQTAGGMAGGKAGAIASTAANVGGAALASVLKGYFVKTTSYLFQLEWTPEIQSEFETTWWDKEDISGFLTSDSYRLKYVGKTWDFAPATMQLSFNSDASQRLISRATVRATDGAIAKLQKKYDQFKTLATLHTDGDGLYAYIGKKEGVGSGDKYAVLEQVMDKDGKVTFDKVGTIKVSKGKVWDNRAGAGETIEGAATGQEDGDTDPTLTSTRFDGKAGKFMDGMLLRQEK